MSTNSRRGAVGNADALAERRNVRFPDAATGEREPLEADFAGSHALLDVLASFRACKQDRFSPRGINEEREIETARRDHGTLDQNAARLGAGRAGLGGDESLA